MKERETCDSCGQALPRDQLKNFDGSLICPKCLERETVLCSHCGTRIWKNENAGAEATPLCQHCYDRYYMTCDRCGRIIHEDDACYLSEDSDTPYCSACYMALRSSHIRDYYYKPDPVFHGTGPRFFGVELEIDEAGESECAASQILRIGNAGGREHIYCKHDGSLEDGFEIVSHPMSLDYHLRSMPWAEVLAKAQELGYTSHQARTCGLHVHVSRDAFGSTEAEQDACIARILYIFEKHWEEILKFSRRTPRQLERWATRYGYKESPGDILSHAKDSRSNRYTCVNLTNVDTVEFRVFRGTLKLNTFLATLQLVDRICDVALCLSDEELKAMSWTTFSAGCTQRELVQYLKERRLYVNDPVAMEAEV